MSGVKYPVNQRVINIQISLKKKGISLSKVTGISGSTISDIKNEKYSASIQVVEKIVRNVEGINTHWIITGEGSMWLEEKKGSFDEAQAYYEQIKLTNEQVEAIAEKKGYVKKSAIAPMQEDIAAMKELLKKIDLKAGA